MAITMHKLTKKIEKELKEFSKILPPEQYSINIKSKMSGADLLLSGHKEVQGKEIDPGKEYIIPNVLVNDHNHYRRLKRAYQSNGKEGIAHYGCKFFKPEGREGFRDHVMKQPW